MKRRDVLIGGALVGLSPVLNQGGAVNYRPATNMHPADLSITEYRTRIFKEWAISAAQGEVRFTTKRGDLHVWYPLECSGRCQDTFQRTEQAIRRQLAARFDLPIIT